jgi:hypothetical protein
MELKEVKQNKIDTAFAGETQARQNMTFIHLKQKKMDMNKLLNILPKLLTMRKEPAKKRFKN